MTKNQLSVDLKVACEIYKSGIKDEPIWYGRLVERLDGKVSKNLISGALDTLSDWGIMRTIIGETENGRAGMLFEICDIHKERISALYEQFWKG